MSLLAVYHDSKRAAVCSDDRSISFSAAGEAVAMDSRVPKFMLVGTLLFAAVGQSDVCGRIERLRFGSTTF